MVLELCKAQVKWWFYVGVYKKILLFLTAAALCRDRGKMNLPGILSADVSRDAWDFARAG